MASTPSSAETAPPAAAVGVIGRYRVIGRLGKGGMAEVLLTLEHDRIRDFKRLVVVKRVLPALEEEDPQFAQMFLDEARLGARLNHANIVQTYEVGEDGGSPYLAIEFLEGQSLHVMQRRLYALERPIPINVALRIFCDVLEGLHYAHELKDFDGRPLGVIHRDVTPSNLFVKYDGVSKLVDFGIAKSATQREKTRAGVMKGKMAYMAPEQLRDEPFTRSVDVWAAGVVIWETLAGSRLFRGKNDFETVQAVMRRPIPKLATLRNDIPPGLDAAIAAAIERDPAKRLKTAEELKIKLEDVAHALGAPLRRTDVATLMREIFSEAIEQNQKMVRDFLEKSDGAVEQEYLRVKSSGALEIRRDEEISGSGRHSREGSMGSLEGSRTPSSTLPVASVSEVTAQRTVSSGSYNDATTVSKSPMDTGGTNTALKRPADAGAIEGDDDAPARPAWHWMALAVALVILGVASWMLLR